MILRKLSQHEEAIAAFDKALAIVPNHPLAFFHQACCYAAIGKHNWALEHLRRAITLDTKTYLRKVQREPTLRILQEQGAARYEVPR
ncbi:MAG: tetratricopeptide repeat protein [Leptolyngbya sp. SIO1D8]|nr:tetratricopeptide repeat protein [Leptolyngbya sp. SIO1D8]